MIAFYSAKLDVTEILPRRDPSVAVDLDDSNITTERRSPDIGSKRLARIEIGKWPHLLGGKDVLRTGERLGVWQAARQDAAKEQSAETSADTAQTSVEVLKKR